MKCSKLLSCGLGHKGHWKTLGPMSLTAVFVESGKFFRKNFLKFIFRDRGKEGERERETMIGCPVLRALARSKLEAQACALTGNRTGDLSLYRAMPCLLSHTGQG